LTNVYQGTVIIRFNLDQLRDGTLNSIPNIRGDRSTNPFVPVQGATNKMYWATHKSNHEMSIFSWADNSMRYGVINREIPAYLPANPRAPPCSTPEWVNCGHLSCPSPNGVNWCKDILSRETDGGWVGGGTIGFYWNARQDPLWLQELKRAFNVPANPFPYVQVVTFREDQLATSIGGGQIWNSDYAIVLPSIAPTSRGLGMAAFFGGGALYPNLAVGRGNHPLHGFFPLPTFWVLNPVAMGTDTPPPDLDMMGNLVRDQFGNTVTRWGDYLAARPFSGAGPFWIASGYVLQGGNAGANVRPMYVIFGTQ
jgi:hypothetical protein